MKYIINKGRLKVRDIRLMQSGDLTAAVTVMAACMVGPDDKPLDQTEALDFLDDLSIDELNAEADTFSAVLQEAENIAVPLANGGRSYRR
jgi:hypothetical protein